jgi:cobalt-zinc-cadmium resistance protein CzcA
MGRLGVNITDAQAAVRTAYAGSIAGQVLEEERRFDLVARLDPEAIQRLDLSALTVPDGHGVQVPLNRFAQVKEVEGPMLISREDAKRYINVGVNVRDRDIRSLTDDIDARLTDRLALPPGYAIKYGGAFENLQHATERLLVAVPIALGLILFFLFMAFGSWKKAAIIFLAVPLSAVGGIAALYFRDMPFSISSGIGFIALFGVSVLNGIVLLSAIDEEVEANENPEEGIMQGALSRLRPVLMTASVAAFGFLPMALSTGSGAEVQRPLATVVIGGLVSSTLLTLLVLPAIYRLGDRFGRSIAQTAMSLALLLFLPLSSEAQDAMDWSAMEQHALEYHPRIQELRFEQERIELERGAKVLWGPLDLSYQQGQINYDGQDRWIQVGQDVSPLIRFEERARMGDWLDAREEARSVQSHLQKQELIFDWKSTYLEWSYATQLAEWQERIAQRYARIASQIKERVAGGLMDPVAGGLFQQSLKNAQADALRARNSAERLASTLRTEMLIPTDVEMLASALDRPPPPPDAQQGDSVFQSFKAARMDVLEYEGRLERTRGRQADVQLGYFNQTLEGTEGFQGFLVGMQMPLDRRPNRQSKEYTRLQLAQESARLGQIGRARQSLRQTLHAQLDDMWPLVRDDAEDAFPGLSLLETLENRFTEGALSYLEYAQSMELLLDQERSRLQILLDYHLTLAEYESLQRTLR